MQNFNYQFFSLAFFAFNGFAVTIFILLRSWLEDSSEGFWLGSFTLLCSLYVCPFMFGYLNWYAIDGYREFLFYVPFQQLFLIGPVFYGYLKKLLITNTTSQNKTISWLHFLPAVVYTLYSLIACIADLFILNDVYFYADGRDKDLKPWYQFTGLISMIFYAGLSLKEYQNYRKKIEEQLSYADSVLYKWVQLFLLCLVIILGTRIIFIVLFPNFGSFGSKYWYYLIFSLLAYFLTLQGFAHFITSINLRNTLHIHHPQAVGMVQNTIEDEVLLKEVNNKTFKINESSLIEQKQQLQERFESQRLYENPHLNLQLVAQEMGWQLKETSMIINQGFGKNFNDFVNGFRVDAVKKQLINGEHLQKTLLAIALDSGFNSKSTFNRVFKRLAKQQPNEFIQSLVK